MSLAEITRKFLQDIQATKWPEWVSTITQVASVWYARKNDVLVYPTGIVGVLLAAYIYFFETKPPLYGWYNWVQKKDADHYTFPIRWCNKKELMTGFLFFIGSWIAIYFALIHFTDSNTPVLDSLVSSSAITAMWWMAKRKIENWLAWIFSNIIAIPLNFYKGLMLFTVMYVLFLVLAAWGYAEWKKKAETA